MSKRFRRAAQVIAIILLFAMVFSSCAKKDDAGSKDATPPAGNSPDASGTGDSAPSVDKVYKIGLNTWGSGVPALDRYGDYAQYFITDVLGGTVMRSSDDFTPDIETANVQNFASAGCDGVTLQAAGYTNLMQMATILQNAKIPFVINTFPGPDEDREKMKEDNPYYLGIGRTDTYGGGKIMGELAYENGARKALIIGGNIGDIVMDYPQNGFTDGFTAKGGEIVAVARCVSAAEAPQKMADMLSANMDADVVFALIGDYVPAAYTALKNAGVEDKFTLYAAGIDDATAALIKDGTITAGVDGVFLGALIVPSLIYNYLDGHQILNNEGKAPEIYYPQFVVDSSNIDAYMSIFCTPGVYPIPDSILKSLCYRYNPDVSFKDYEALMNGGMTLNKLLEAHGLPTVD